MSPVRLVAKYTCVYDVQLVAIRCIPLLAVVLLLSLALRIWACCRPPTLRAHSQAIFYLQWPDHFRNAGTVSVILALGMPSESANCHYDVTSCPPSSGYTGCYDGRATVSRAKSFQDFIPIFLQSCKTKSGMESLGLGLVHLLAP